MPQYYSNPLTLRDALLGGPGLDGYAYQAAIYCKHCGQDITRQVFADNPSGILYPDAQDSEVVPQPVFFGEADYAVHCEECGEYLYGPLE